MIAKMRKLNLAALYYDRDLILNALERTNAVEIREHAAVEGTVSLPEDSGELRTYLSGLEGALAVLEKRADGLDKKKNAAVKDGFSVSYAEFAASADKKEEMDALVSRIGELTEQEAACRNEQAGLRREIAAALPYAGAALPFAEYADTAHVRTRLGVVGTGAWEGLKPLLDAAELAGYEAVEAQDAVLLTLSVHKSAYTEVEQLLTAAGFTPCPYRGNMTGAQQLAELQSRLAASGERERIATEALAELTSEIRTLKIYCDYVGFLLEKAETVGLMRGTERVFFLEAFVPAEQEEAVKTALEGTMSAIWYEFSDPSEDEFVPTLMKNNKVIENFETITNMYSPPDAREMDPNTVMSFFYSLFVGFIMADIGYGILMMLGGGGICFMNRKKKGGVKALAGVFAVSGIFAVLWGILFNSLFGIAVLPFTVMPNVQTEMYTVLGIGLPAVLVISLMLGVVQLMAGYLCKAVQAWRHGGILDGIFDGVVWAVFSVGVELALIGLVEEFRLSFLTMAGGIVAGVALLVAVLTAGRKQKFFGKITKGFASIYGLINYFSDVLSYLRLYALLLTGAIIAQVVSQYALDFFSMGPLFAVLGVLLMIVGHIFNLAIGLLGAYIHTARLQYIEFFGKFYEGNGELFVPFGSKKKYIDLETTPAAAPVPQGR